MIDQPIYIHIKDPAVVNELVTKLKQKIHLAGQILEKIDQIDDKEIQLITMSKKKISDVELKLDKVKDNMTEVEI